VGNPEVLAQGLLNSTRSIVGVAIASALYALVSLVCMLMLLNRTGYWANELSTAEQADVDDLTRERAALTDELPQSASKTVPAA